MGPTCTPNLGTLAQRVSELEGKKRKCKSAPCGRTFAPSGPFDPMALKSDQVWPECLGSRRPPVWAAAVFKIFFEGFTRRHVAGHT